MWRFRQREESCGDFLFFFFRNLQVTNFSQEGREDVSKSSKGRDRKKKKITN